MHAIREFLEFFGPLFIVAAFLIGGTLYGVNKYEGYLCRAYGETTGKAVKYVQFGDCFVETKNGWLTKDQYSATLVAREGLSK